MKETPPDIDIARELDIFSKAHFPTTDSNDHQQQQQSHHTIHSALPAGYNQHHYNLAPQFGFTSSASASSSPSTSFLHPSTVTNILRPVPNHSIAALNSLLSSHTIPKNPDNLSLYENYPLSYQNAMTDSTHSRSGSPLSGYTTPTPYTNAHQNASSEEQQKQQTFDQFMSMMNMVDQRLQELDDHDSALFSSPPGTSHTSAPSSTSSTSASLFSHSDHQLTNGTAPKTTPAPVISSSTPTRTRGRRKKTMSLGDRKGKKPVTTTTKKIPATPTASSSYPTNATLMPHHERNSDSNSDLDDVDDGDDDDEDDDDDDEDDEDRRLASGQSSSDPQQRDAYAKDKRRRNTEASARFRVKKKMREQALRRTADEMTLRSQHLQQRVHELEKEVKWLRELIVEKKQSYST